MDYYLLTASGTQAGPYSLEQLREFWANGKVTLETPYWTKGMLEWVPLRRLESALIAHGSNSAQRSLPAPRNVAGAYERPKLPILGINSFLGPLLGIIFCLSVASFFLPAITVSVPILGVHGDSMFDVAMIIKDRYGKFTPGTFINSIADNAQEATEAANQPESEPPREETVGNVICAISVVLLVGHYCLTLIWGFITLAFRKIYQFLTFIWLGVAVLFPILWLIGIHMRLDSLAKQSEGDLANDPLSAIIGQVVIGNVNAQPGITIWILTSLSVVAILLLFVSRDSTRVVESTKGCLASLLWISIVAVSLIILSLATSSSTGTALHAAISGTRDVSSSFSEYQPTPPTISAITWEEVNNIYQIGSSYTDLQKNEYWKLYQGKYVRWTGKVDNVYETPSRPIRVFLMVKMNQDIDASDVDLDLKVDVALRDSQNVDALRLSQGEIITFTGKLDEWHSGMDPAPDILLSDGEIEPSNK